MTVTLSEVVGCGMGLTISVLEMVVIASGAATSLCAVDGGLQNSMKTANLGAT